MCCSRDCIFKHPSLQEAAMCYQAVGTYNSQSVKVWLLLTVSSKALQREQLLQEDQCAWEIPAGWSIFLKLRFKSFGYNRNRVKCFEIDGNQIWDFSLNVYTQKICTIFSSYLKVQQVYQVLMSLNVYCDIQYSSSWLLNYFLIRLFNFKTSYYTGHVLW